MAGFIETRGGSKITFFICSLFLFLALAVFIIFYALADEVEGSRSPGKWKDGSFSQVHTYCIQTWMCIPGEDVLHGPDTFVATSPNELVTGVCNAGDGAIDSCNLCSSSPPVSPCEYWLERK